MSKPEMELYSSSAIWAPEEGQGAVTAPGKGPMVVEDQGVMVADRWEPRWEPHE